MGFLLTMLLLAEATCFLTLLNPSPTPFMFLSATSACLITCLHASLYRTQRARASIPSLTENDFRPGPTRNFPRKIKFQVAKAFCGHGYGRVTGTPKAIFSAGINRFSSRAVMLETQPAPSVHLSSNASLLSYQ